MVLRCSLFVGGVVDVEFVCVGWFLTRMDQV